MIPYIKLFADASATVDLLSDAEAGRLIKALLHYSNGVVDELPGQEKLVFAMLKSQIDRDAATYQDFCDKQRENGKKGGRPKNPMVLEENPENPVVFSETQKTQEKEKEEEEDKEIKEKQEKEKMPFGLTEEDIQKSITQDQQIEDKARSIGLQVTEAGMMRGRDLARQYGLDKLLEAMTKAVDRPTWAYVEGILRKGGQDRGHRDDRGNAQGEVRTDYSFLRELPLP